jgi:hypothetical protein
MLPHEPFIAAGCCWLGGWVDVNLKSYTLLHGCLMGCCCWVCVQVLIADFFLVLAILAWLGVGLLEKATVQSSNLVDAWLPLWPLVFQPAIGVLMAGALVSGGLNWLQEQQQKK